MASDMVRTRTRSAKVGVVLINVNPLYNPQVLLLPLVGLVGLAILLILLVGLVGSVALHCRSGNPTM